MLQYPADDIATRSGLECRRGKKWGAKGGQDPAFGSQSRSSLDLVTGGCDLILSDFISYLRGMKSLHFEHIDTWGLIQCQGEEDPVRVRLFKCVIPE